MSKNWVEFSLDVVHTSPDIRESDWKLFREFHPIALNRYCQRFLEDVGGVVADGSKTPHDRYGEIYSLVRQATKELARGFDDKRRSTAVVQLAIIHSHGLITEEELSRFFFRDPRGDYAAVTSNQSMKPTAPFRNAFSVFATTPCRGLSLSR